MVGEQGSGETKEDLFKGKKKRTNLRTFPSLGCKPGMANRFISYGSSASWWWLLGHCAEKDSEAPLGSLRKGSMID